MNGWKPTLGKWNDHDDYDIKLPVWKKAYDFAAEKYRNAGTVIQLKDQTYSYAEHVRNVMGILTGEANCRGDNILTLCALCRVAEKTGCSWDEILNFCPNYQIEQLRSFPLRADAPIPEYLQKAFQHTTDTVILIIILAEIISELRMKKCSGGNYTEDNDLYDHLETILDGFTAVCSDDKVMFLCHKLKTQIEDNRKCQQKHQ